MKNLFPIAAGVVLYPDLHRCRLPDPPGLRAGLYHRFSGLRHRTLCIGGILRHVTRRLCVAPRSHKTAPPHSGGACLSCRKKPAFLTDSQNRYILFRIF